MGINDWRGHRVMFVPEENGLAVVVRGRENSIEIDTFPTDRISSHIESTDLVNLTKSGGVGKRRPVRMAKINFRIESPAGKFLLN
jgi:hypothetical protein